MIKPRKLPPEVAEIRQRYISLSKAGSKYMAYLQIDHQTFPVCVEYTTKKRAEWFRDMLAIALHRLASASAPCSAWVALKPSDSPQQGFYWWRPSSSSTTPPVIHRIWNDEYGIRATSQWHSPDQGCLCGEWWGPLTLPNV